MVSYEGYNPPFIIDKPGKVTEGRFDSLRITCLSKQSRCRLQRRNLANSKHSRVNPEIIDWESMNEKGLVSFIISIVSVERKGAIS